MTNSKNTRRALMTSALAILMCIAMLIGTTFAWFTDTASTAVNKIQAGTLDIALEMKDGENWVDAEGKTLEFKKAAGAPADEEVLWEPGCTYELPEVRVVNNGDLALKYKIVLSGIKGDAKLNEAIEWTIGGLDLDTEGTLLAGATSDALTIKGHMKEDAGNEYQGLSIDGIAITVYATQYTYEYDSIDDQYDRHSTYPVEIIAEIKDAELTKETVTDSGSGEDVEVFSYANSDGTAKVSVPATGVSQDATPVVSIKPTEADATASATVSAEGKDAIAYDITITNLDGETKATIEIYIGKGLTGIEVFHNDSAMSADDYSYNATTGYLTIKSATFSPFTIAYDATLFEGNGSKDNPFIIKNADDFNNINAYSDSYNYYKVADGVTEIDCTNLNYVDLYGEFDGNGVTFTNVNKRLFRYAGYYGSEEPTVLKNFTAVMNTSASVVFTIDSKVTTFENVKVSGILEGNWNMGAFVNYGSCNSDNVGFDYTLNFVKCSCDATIIAKQNSSAAILVGHTYPGTGHTATINLDAATEEGIKSAKIYAANNATGCKYFSNYQNTLNVYLDGAAVTDQTYPATALASTVPVKGDAGYTLAVESDTKTVKAQVVAQLTGFDEEGNQIANQVGITMTLGDSIKISDISGNSADIIGTISSVEVVNGKTESGYCEYKLENGKLTVYTNSTANYITGTVSIIVSQYNGDGALIGTGTLVLAERKTVDSVWAVK